MLAGIQVDCRRDLPEDDPDHSHRLAGDEVLVIKHRTLGVPLRQELVFA